MKKLKMLMICFAVVGSLYAADDGSQHSLIGRARAAVASGQQERMDVQLMLISSFPVSDASDAMRMLLDAGANGAFTKKGIGEGMFGWLEEPTESPLISAAMSYCPHNISILREWSQAHGNVIDSNEGRYTYSSNSSEKRDDSLLGKVVTGACANSRFPAKLQAVKELLQFSDVEIDLPYSTGLTPLHEAVQHALYELGLGHQQVFETYLEIVTILREHEAQVTGDMQAEVRHAAERKEDLQTDYDRIMEALRQPAVKSTSKR